MSEKMPFWSPDSLNIAFFANAKLKRIPASGGTARTLADAPNPDGGNWFQQPGGEETIVFTPDRVGPLHLVSASGGPATSVTKGSDGGHIYPQFLPDGRVLYLGGLGDKRGIYVQYPGESADRQLLLATTNRAAYAQLGYLLYIRGDTLVARKLNLRTLQFQGEAVPLAESVNVGSGRAAFAVSDGGLITYRSTLGNRQLVTYSREGKRAPLPLEFGSSLRQIELSPDGQRLAIIRSGTSREIWLLELSSGILSNLTSSLRASLGTRPANKNEAVWSPDSRRLIFQQVDWDSQEFHELTIGGGDRTIYRFPTGSNTTLDDWSRDGKLLVVHNWNRGISVLPVTGERDENSPQIIYETRYRMDEVRVSPDGQSVVYTENASGQTEVYSARFPSFTDRRQISKGGGMQPRWREDGREVFYLAPDANMMAIEIRSGPALQAGKPQVLFPTSIPTETTWHFYAVSRDGRLFFAVEPVSGDAESIHVITNWTALMR